MKKKYLILVWSLFLCSSMFAQDLSFKSMPLLFFHEASDEMIIIDNDSMVYNLNKNVNYQLKHTNYPGKLINYNCFNVNKRTFFVHEGCGPVLEYRNDSIVRIDNSFLHFNQFGAAKFVYNNEIYFMGGYGLFTYKNILTKYDFKQKEWFLVETKNTDLVEELSNTFYILQDDELFVFGGSRLSSKGESFNNDHIYKLNLKTLEWNVFRTDLFKSIKDLNVVRKTKNAPYLYNSNYFIYSDTRIAAISLLDNEITTYDSFFRQPLVDCLLYGDSIYTILIDFGHESKSNFSFKKFKAGNLNSKPIDSSAFYYKTQPYLLYLFIVIILILLGFTIYKAKTFILFFIYSKKPFHYFKLSKTLYFKGKKVKQLSEGDVKILETLVANLNTYVSLNFYNELFSINYKNDNYAAIVKRREKKLDSFIKIISNVSGYNYQQIVEERKSTDDKRIKEILFLPNKLKVFNK